MEPGTKPPVFSIRDLAEHGSARLSKAYREYFNEGANDLLTLRDNEAAFDRYKLRPRILRNVSKVDTSTTIFGSKVSFPFGFAPAAMHGLAHPEGEIATSRAAASTGIAMGLSSWATQSVEDVTAEGMGNPYAMQVSLLKDTEITQTVCRRAEKSGCKAILLTVDAPILGRRFNESRNKFDLPENLTLPHLVSSTGKLLYGKHVYDNSLNWERALHLVREQTTLPIWIKGVYTPEDVELAIDHGVDGIIISNHGGRQLDSVPATLDALRVCAPVAQGKVPIAIDGGIRRGSDIFKALALGANFCFAGRIPIWGLAYDGQKGVELAVKLLLEEFELCMGLAGCRNVREISRAHLSILLPDGLLSKL
ncbi:FMN-dependent dehydrogenase [Polychaeton citri CBS 116435]|uniref:Oxidase FUB9 n=1 Tax=Polychaeton citri CBS 116435 TaxID=1314669 RepID=A0A9P4QAQ9_9PEZI|nr:FMN-dependent dehydrogenase [Polychaeton citri CBS 116435]